MHWNRDFLFTSCLSCNCTTNSDDSGQSFRLKSQNYAGRTFSAQGPFGPLPSVNVTRWPSCKSLKLAPCTLDEWKNRSLPPPTLMNPNPLSVNFLMLPSAIWTFPWTNFLLCAAIKHFFGKSQSHLAGKCSRIPRLNANGFICNPWATVRNLISDIHFCERLCYVLGRFAFILSLEIKWRKSWEKVTTVKRTTKREWSQSKTRRPRERNPTPRSKHFVVDLWILANPSVPFWVRRWIARSDSFAEICRRILRGLARKKHSLLGHRLLDAKEFFSPATEDRLPCNDRTHGSNTSPSDLLGLKRFVEFECVALVLYCSESDWDPKPTSNMVNL